MRNTFLFASIAMAICGVAHADVVTFTPFDLEGISPAYIFRASPDGAYLSGTDTSGAVGFRYDIKSGHTDLFPNFYPLNMNNAGTLAGWVGVNGGVPNGGTNTGAYVPIGMDPIEIANPLLVNSGAYGISDDGTLVGLSSTSSSIVGAGGAYIWTAATGMKMLPTNRPARYSRPNGISTDGHIIYGWNDDLTGFRSGTIWVDGAPHDIAPAPGIAYAGEAGGISANDQFVVGSFALNAMGQNLGGWRWNRADNSVMVVPDMGYVFGVSNDGKTIIGNAPQPTGPLRPEGESDSPFSSMALSAFGSSTAGGSNSVNGTPAYNARTALIWREGFGTIRLADWITQNGGTIPDTYNPDLAGSALNMTGDATFMSGWSATSLTASYTVTVTPDKLFSDNFDSAAPLGVFATLSPTTILTQSAQGAPAILSIDLDNPGKTDATLTDAFVDEFPSGLIVAAAPNASNTCSDVPLAAYPGYDYVALPAGAVIPAGGHCVISVAVTSNTSGTFQNVIPANSLLTDAGTNLTNSFSSVTVLPGGNGIVRSGAINHVMADTASGSSINWTTGAINDAGPGTGPWDLKLFHSSTTGHVNFRVVASSTFQDGIAVDTSNTVQILHAGDVIGPSTYFIYATGASNFITPQEMLDGTDGYVGVRFKCDTPRQVNQVANGFCYGYMHLQTTAGTTGYPVTLVDFAFNGDGKAITVGQ